MDGHGETLVLAARNTLKKPIRHSFEAGNPVEKPVREANTELYCISFILALVSEKPCLSDT